jgi:hypothetical protein
MAQCVYRVRSVDLAIRLSAGKHLAPDCVGGLQYEVDLIFQPIGFGLGQFGA